MALYLCPSYSLKDAPLYTLYFCLKRHPSVPDYVRVSNGVSLYINILGYQRCPPICMDIWVSTDSVYAYIRASIDSSQDKSTLSIPMTPYFICLHLGCKGCPSVYAHIMVLIKPIFKCSYLCLKTCPLSISGPVNILVYLYQHQGFQNDFLYTA